MATATQITAPTTEFGLRHDATGQVTHWGKWDHLALSDPKDYPGYTVVAREVSAWTTAVSTEGATRA